MPIVLPDPAVAWNILACQRVTYVSVVQVMRDVIFKVKVELKARGWTVKGSSNGAAGGMDAVDRWVTAADAGTRFNGAGGAQSWIVLTDGDGADIVFSYNAAADDIYNIRVSPGGVATVAGTATFEPTIADSLDMNKFYTTTVGTIVNATASLDRLVSVWTSPDHKSFRVAIARNGTWVSMFGKERFTPATYAGGIVVHPGFAHYINGGAAAGTRGENILFANAAVTAAITAQIRTAARRTDGAGAVLQCARYCKVIGSSTTAPTIGPDATDQQSVQADLQGAASYALRKMGLYSHTSSHIGDVGLMIDWFLGRITGAGDGDTYGALRWIVMKAVLGIVWPWDTTTVVAMS